MKLVLVRHAETEENIRHVFPEVIEGRLSQNGRNQAKDLGRKLVNKQIDAILCSPARRCQETLALIQEESGWEVKPTIEEELRERNYGELKGKPTSTMIREERDGDSPRNREMGMEDHKEVGVRTKRLLDRIKVDYKDKTVMIVGHGEPLVWMCAEIMNKSYKEVSKLIEVKNAEAVEFDL